MAGIVDLMVRGDIAATIEAGEHAGGAEGDATVLAAVRARWYPAEAWLEPLGGLRSAETRFPLTAAELTARLTARYGERAVRRLRAADARVLAVVRAAARTAAALGEAQDRRSYRTQQVAFLHLDRAQEDHRLSHADVLAAFALAEEGLPGGWLGDVEIAGSSLATVGEMLWDQAFPGVGALPADADAAVRTRVAQLVAEADGAQRISDLRVLAGEQLRGAVVGRDTDRGEDLTVTGPLGPAAGWTDEGLAIAQARSAGAACAVVNGFPFPPVFYVCSLSRDFTYPDVRSTTVQLGRADLVTHGARVDVRALVTREGHVLLPDRDGQYYAALALAYDGAFITTAFPEHEPGPYVDADFRLAEWLAEEDSARADADRADVPLDALFAQAVLDFTLGRLARAERAVAAQLRRFAPDGGLAPDAGAALKRATAELRDAVYLSAALAFSIGDREPLPDESRLAARLASTVGRVTAEEPMAMRFIRADRDPGDQPTFEMFENLLLEQPNGDGDVALRARDDLLERQENIRAFRDYLITHHPEASRRLAVLHPDVLLAFTDHQRASIELSLLGDELRHLAADLGVTVGLLFVWILAVVDPALVAVANGLSAAVGYANLPATFEQAELLAMTAAMDVPGGFQLASPEDAASARRWAWIGLGLTVLDVALLPGDLSRQLRRATTGEALFGATLAAVAFAETAPPPPHREARDPARATTRAAGTTHASALTASASAAAGTGSAGTLRRLAAAAELANSQRLASAAFKELAAELRIPQRTLRRLLLDAVDEATRAAVVARLRSAAADILAGRSAAQLEAGQVLRPAGARTRAASLPGVREHLVIGGSEAQVGWGLELLDAGRRTTLLAPARTAAVDAFEASHGRFVQGGLIDLPAGYQCSVAREELFGAVASADASGLVAERVARLRQGGQWVLVTDSAELAERLAQVAPQPGTRIWATELTTISGTTPVRRHVVVLARPRPTTMTALASIAQPAGLTGPALAQQLALLTSSSNLGRLQRKLAHVWHQGLVEGGQVGEWVMRNLTGNIGEIFADGYKEQVRVGRVTAGEAGATLHRDIRRIDAVTGQSKEFTDDIVGVVRDGNLHVLDVFEVKAGPRGGQEAATQLFEWMENTLQEGDRIVVGGRAYVYNPRGTGPGRVVGLGSARRHIVTAKGAEAAGRHTADTIAAEVVRSTLRFGDRDLNAAHIRYLARKVIEGLPPAP
jgi:hypothetical protein